MPRSRFTCRRGFSLLEVLLTLAVLVVLGSLAWPSLHKSFQNQALLKAADRVRLEWTSARVWAMTTGQVVAFRFQPEGGQYTVVPWADLEPPAGTSGLTAVSSGEVAAAAMIPLSASGTLPENIRFVGDGVLRQASARDEGFDSLEGALSGEGQMWSTPLFFYPDGRTSTGQVTLANDLGRSIVVELRGLTGTAKVLPMGNLGVAP
jgi:prepilin-type N-terminal cleavage/methylation domain-containing protein